MDDARCSWLNQGGTTELLKPPSLGQGLEAFVFFRLLKIPSRGVLGRVPPCDVPYGYASVVSLPVALRERYFEQSHKIREVEP